METIRDIESLRAQVHNWRKSGESIAFVPTMGNLHAGHLSLVDIAANKADHVIVSIYVNPLQFGPNEDFDCYPRTLDDDLGKLLGTGVDLVFIPDNSSIYGSDGDIAQSSFCEVPVLSDILEGEYRPGFFRGVATVVLKLFHLVEPDIAVFGEKDFQQLLVIRKMVTDLCLPVSIISGETLRETDGLAMSSRNGYLSQSEREKSRKLYENLQRFKHLIEQGNSIDQAEEYCIEELSTAGFSVDYLTIREASGLQQVSDDDLLAGCEMVVLAAARLGKTRLIDNIKFVC